MSRPAENARVLRFGVFEVDLRAGELRKAGLKVKLQEQPFQVLAILLQSAGEVVPREELQQRLWPADTFVDFEHSLNTAVKKLRQALDDDSDNPRFIETLPRRGYRFIAPVGGVVETPSPAEGISQTEAVSASVTPTFIDTAASAKEGVVAGRRMVTKWPAYRVVLVGAFIALVGSVILWKWRIGPATPVRVLRFVQLTNDSQAKAGPMGTDGVRIYFNETLPGQVSTIATVSTQGGETVPLSIPLKKPQIVDLSRDGTEMLVTNQEGTGPNSLWILPVAGGSPRRVGAVFVDEARWGRDGETVIYSRGGNVYLVNKDGSAPRKLLSASSNPYSFQFSPDGRSLRFSKSEGIDSVFVTEASADGTNLRRLFRGCCGKWTPDGRYYVFENEHDGRIDLWAVREDSSFVGRRVDRRPMQLTGGPLDFMIPTPSKNGKQIFAIGVLNRAEVVRYDEHSHEFTPYLSGISAEGLSFSRDGQWVTYTSYPDGALWRSRTDGSERLQLTFRPLRVLLPRYSPDGKQIAFSASTPGREWSIYLLSNEGGTPQQVLPDEHSQMDGNWSADGNSLVFGSFDIPNAPISIVDLRTKQVSILPGSNGLFSPRWSPDGRYICAIRSEAPGKLMLFDFTTQKWTELVSYGMGYPSWSHDGKYIYFQDWHDVSQNGSESVLRIRLSDHQIENILDLKSVGRLTAGTFAEWSGLAPDDSTLLARDISSQEVYALEWDAP